MKRATQFIGHLDADCFYVSAERVRCPGLRKKPVGVLGNQGACVIAKSYELKASGVQTGAPIWEAAKLCPQAIYVKRDFPWYEALSRRILGIVREWSPTVEYYSIDELFFDASFMLAAARGTELARARELQRLILESVGVPVTIGIAETRTLAKLASDTAKPFGCSIWPAQERAKLLKGRPVSDVTGIAKRRAETLARQGLHTCEEFAKADRALVRKLITRHGEHLWWELNGVPVLPLHTTRPPHKVVARGGSVGAATGDQSRIEAWLIRNTERLVDAIDQYGYVADRLGLYLGYKDRRGTYGNVTLLGPTASFEHAAPAFRSLFERLYAPGGMVQSMHLIAESLQFREHAQRSLFIGEPSRPTQTSIIKAVNREAGRFSVRSAATLPLAGIYGDEAYDYDVCDVAGKMCF